MSNHVMNPNYQHGVYRLHFYFMSGNGVSHEVHKGPYASLRKAKSERTRILNDQWSLSNIAFLSDFGVQPKVQRVAIEYTPVDWQEVDEDEA